jgi:hypothetical protein
VGSTDHDEKATTCVAESKIIQIIKLPGNLRISNPRSNGCRKPEIGLRWAEKWYRVEPESRYHDRCALLEPYNDDSFVQERTVSEIFFVNSGIPEGNCQSGCPDCRSRSKRAANITELYENTRAEGFNWETKKRIIMGTYGLSAGYYDAYYEKACKVRRVISGEFEAAFRNVDCLVWPTRPTPAFQFGSHSSDPVSMYLEDVFTVPVNLAGLPAISLPVSISQSLLPMGLQVIGPRFGDADVFRVAKTVEERVGKLGLTSLVDGKQSLEAWGRH